MLEKKIRDILLLYGPGLVSAENWQDQLCITGLRSVSFQQLKELAALFPDGTEIGFEAESVYVDMYDRSKIPVINIVIPRMGFMLKD